MPSFLSYTIRTGFHRTIWWYYDFWMKKNLVNAFKTLNLCWFLKWPSDVANNWKSIKKKWWLWITNCDAKPLIEKNATKKQILMQINALKFKCDVFVMSIELSQTIATHRKIILRCQRISGAFFYPPSSSKHLIVIGIIKQQLITITQRRISSAH